MKISPRIFASLRLCVVVALSAIAVAGQSIPAPKDVLGWTPDVSFEQLIEMMVKSDLEKLKAIATPDTKARGI